MSTFDSLHENPKGLRNMRKLQMKSMRYKKLFNSLKNTKKILFYFWVQNKNDTDTFYIFDKPFRIFEENKMCSKFIFIY